MAVPLVIPHMVHILGPEQVAFCQRCPLALPSVAPQEQVFGVVQVAALKLWMCGVSVGDSVDGAVGSVAGEVLGSADGSIVGCVDGAPDVSIGREVGAEEVPVDVSNWLVVIWLKSLVEEWDKPLLLHAQSKVIIITTRIEERTFLIINTSFCISAVPSCYLPAKLPGIRIFSMCAG